MLMGARGRPANISKRRSPQENVGVVAEFFAPNISAADLCRKHNMSLTIFQDWKKKFQRFFRPVSESATHNIQNVSEQK